MNSLNNYDYPWQTTKFEPSQCECNENPDVPSYLVTSITYSELKTLRDEGNLVPGAYYRITDYECTVANTAYAHAENNPFDIIVFAIDENNISEEARAARHEGDTYYEYSNFNAWRLLYCIDNDTERFDWADDINGKGVIYRMIDDFNNDAPYDFKNIKFDRAKVINVNCSTEFNTTPSYDGILWANNGGYCLATYNTNARVEIDSNGDSYYTFQEINNSSLYGITRGFNNKITPYINEYNRQVLNNIVMFGASNGNILDNCKDITLGNNCYDNSFYGCEDIIFADYLHDNKLELSVHSVFDVYCQYNVFNNLGYSLIVGLCQSNNINYAFYLDSYNVENVNIVSVNDLLIENCSQLDIKELNYAQLHDIRKSNIDFGCSHLYINASIEGMTIHSNVENFNVNLDRSTTYKNIEIFNGVYENIDMSQYFNNSNYRTVFRLDEDTIITPQQA